MFGIFDNGEAAALTVLGLHALQHRGQEAAGVVDLRRQACSTATVRSAWSATISAARRSIAGLPGRAAIGHVRYSTTGAPLLRNVQPLFADFAFGGLALGHNGNLTNALTLRRQLVERGCLFQSTSDTEVIVHLIARSTPADRGRAPDRCAEPGRGRLCPGRDVGRRALRRARSLGGSAAGPGRARRLADPGVGDLRARHHRRPLRARRRARRAGDLDRRRDREPEAVRAGCRAASASSSTSTSPGPTARSRGTTSTRCASGSAPSSPRSSQHPPTS